MGPLGTCAYLLGPFGGLSELISVSVILGTVPGSVSTVHVECNAWRIQSPSHDFHLWKLASHPGGDPHTCLLRTQSSLTQPRTVKDTDGNAQPLFDPTCALP